MRTDTAEAVIDIKAALLAQAEPSYAAFAAGLLKKPGETELSGSAARLLGVRLPALHKLARRMAKGDWRFYLDSLEDASFEELMLQGFLTGALAPDGNGPELEEIFERAGLFIRKIDNWSLCDSFCSSFKLAKKYPEQVWDFLQPYLMSDQEYEVRFALVMLLNYYIEPQFIEMVYPVFDRANHKGYYVRMAVAWAVSVCFVRFPQRTLSYLKNNSLDDFTFHKALQKITESRSVAPETKKSIREMRRQRRQTFQADPAE